MRRREDEKARKQGLSSLVGAPEVRANWLRWVALSRFAALTSAHPHAGKNGQ